MKCLHFLSVYYLNVEGNNYNSVRIIAQSSS